MSFQTGSYTGSEGGPAPRAARIGPAWCGTQSGPSRFFDEGLLSLDRSEFAPVQKGPEFFPTPQGLIGGHHQNGFVGQLDLVDRPERRVDE